MLYLQRDKNTVDLYVQSFKSHCDTCSAFGPSLGMHEGLGTNMLATADWVVDHDNATANERARAVG